MDPRATLTAILPTLLVYSGVPAPPTRGAMVVPLYALAPNFTEDRTSTSTCEEFAEADIDSSSTVAKPFHPSASHRDTTDAERAAGEIRSWVEFGDDWDGQGAAAPNVVALRNAADFVLTLADDFIAPVPELLASGNVCLVWDHDRTTADLEFYPDGRITYFVESGENGIHKGVVRHFDGNVPAVMAALLPRTEGKWIYRAAA